MVERFERSSHPYRRRTSTVLEATLSTLLAQQMANPSSHPTYYSGLRALPHTGELQR